MQLYTPVTALMFLHKESIDCIILFWPYQVECTLANNGKPKEKQQYYLPTFDTTVETKCFPSICYLDDVEPGLRNLIQMFTVTFQLAQGQIQVLS